MANVQQKDLFTFIERHLHSRQRIIIATSGVIFSLLVIIVSWWFWEEVVHAPWRPRFDIIGYLTAIGLIVAAGFNLIGFLLYCAKSKFGFEVLKFSTTVIGILFIPLIINVGVFLFRSSDLYGFSNLWQSFIDFNRIQIGQLRFSITGLLTILLIALGIIGAIKKEK